MKCIKSVIMPLALALASAASADEIMWIGDQNDGDFNNPLNWDGDQLPGAIDRAIVSDQTDIMITDDIIIDSIEITTSFTEVVVTPGVTLTLENDNNHDIGGPHHECCPPDDNVFDGTLYLLWEDTLGGSHLVLENTHKLTGKPFNRK